MTITSYLPEPKEPLIRIGIDIPPDLAQKMRSALKEQKISWRSFLEASIKTYLSEIAVQKTDKTPPVI